MKWMSGLFFQSNIKKIASTSHPKITSFSMGIKPGEQQKLKDWSFCRKWSKKVYVVVRFGFLLCTKINPLVIYDCNEALSIRCDWISINSIKLKFRIISYSYPWQELCLCFLSRMGQMNAMIDMSAINLCFIGSSPTSGQFCKNTVWLSWSESQLLLK